MARTATKTCLATKTATTPGTGPRVKHQTVKKIVRALMNSCHRRNWSRRRLSSAAVNNRGGAGGGAKRAMQGRPVEAYLGMRVSTSLCSGLESCLASPSKLKRGLGQSKTSLSKAVH